MDETPGPHPLTRRRPESSTSAQAALATGPFRFPRFSVRGDTRSGALRVGITDDGQKVLLHLAPGTKEDTDSCMAFFQDLNAGRLADPLLVVTSSPTARPD